MKEAETHDGLLVRKIESGTVIDHIPAWKSSLVVKALRIGNLMKGESNVSMAILQNVISKRLARKDVVKVDNWFVDQKDADILCLILPSVTVNYIREWKASKYTPKVPDRIEGKLRCPEVRCVSNGAREPVTSRFRTLKPQRMLQCDYCDTLIDFEKIPDYATA